MALRIAISALLAAACSTATPTPQTPAPTIAGLAPKVRIDPRLSDHGIAWSDLGSGPPVLLLNGTGSPMAEWDPRFLSALSQDRRVIVFDYPGLGASTAAARNTFRGLAASTVRLMDDLGLEAADVLGWSMGGFVTQEILRTDPARVRRAVLVGTNPGGRTATLGPRWVQRADSDPRADDTTYLRTNYPHTGCAQRRGEAFLQRLEKAFDSGRYPPPRVPRRTYDAMVDAEEPWLASDRNARQLRTVTTPTLVMVGERDLVTPAANSRTITGLLRNGQLLLVPGAGHSVLFQAPEQSAQAIIAFLEDQEAPAIAWPCAGPAGTTT